MNYAYAESIVIPTTADIFFDIVYLMFNSLATGLVLGVLGVLVIMVFKRSRGGGTSL